MQFIYSWIGNEILYTSDIKTPVISVWAWQEISPVTKSSPRIWKGVSATLQSGRYTLSYPRGLTASLKKRSPPQRETLDKTCRGANGFLSGWDPEEFDLFFYCFFATRVPNHASYVHAPSAVPFVFIRPDWVSIRKATPVLFLWHVYLIAW